MQEDVSADAWQQVLANPDRPQPERDILAAAGRKEGTEHLLGLANPLGGSGSPSSVREYEYFKGLPKDEQDAYLRVKRAQQIIETGGESYRLQDAKRRNRTTKKEE